MAIDMAQFHEAFFEEGFESLDAMEAALLQLDPQAPNSETINSVFRVAHSLKGGAGMFAFADIISFTHTLETLLDELRAGRMPVSSDLVDLLLKSSDVLRGMLKATQRKTPIDQQVVADLQFDLEQLVAQRPSATVAPQPPPATAAPAMPEIAAGAAWHIELKPNPRLLVLGNDPQRMLEELAVLGDLVCQVDTSPVPPLADIDPEVCYLSWNLELITQVTREVIHSVFEWAEGDCELLIRALPADPDGERGSTLQVAAEPVGAVATQAPAAVPALVPAAAAGVQAMAGEARPAAAGKAEAAAEPARTAAADSNSIRVSHREDR